MYACKDEEYLLGCLVTADPVLANLVVVQRGPAVIQHVFRDTTRHLKYTVCHTLAMLVVSSGSGLVDCRAYGAGAVCYAERAERVCSLGTEEQTRWACLKLRSQRLQS